jgi:hypothetical protein
MTVKFYAYKRRGVVHRSFQPVLVLRDGTLLRAGLDRGVPDTAVKHARACAAQASLPYLPGPADAAAPYVHGDAVGLAGAALL